MFLVAIVQLAHPGSVIAGEYRLECVGFGGVVVEGVRAFANQTRGRVT
jgi:hypothetical protein